MKKVFTILLVSLITSFHAQASKKIVITVHDTMLTKVVDTNIVNGNYFNAITGDTVMWVLAGNGPKYIVDTIKPTNASSWSCTLTVAQPTCGYIIGIGGLYHYRVKSDTDSLGMRGRFKALGGSIGSGGQVDGGVNGIDENVALYSVAYPNPFQDKILISLSKPGGDLTIYNVVGEQIKRIKLENNQTKVELDLSNIPSGIYFYNVSKEGIIVETKKIIKS